MSPGIDSKESIPPAYICSLAGRYDSPIPTRFLALQGLCSLPTSVLNFHHSVYLKITHYAHCFFIYREEPSAVNNNNHTANFTSGKPLVLQMPPPAAAASSSFSSAAAAQLAVPSPPHLSTPPPKIRSTSPGACNCRAWTKYLYPRHGTLNVGFS